MKKKTKDNLPGMVTPQVESFGLIYLFEIKKRMYVKSFEVLEVQRVSVWSWQWLAHFCVYDNTCTCKIYGPW